MPTRCDLIIVAVYAKTRHLVRNFFSSFRALHSFVIRFLMTYRHGMIS